MTGVYGNPSPTPDVRQRPVLTMPVTYLREKQTGERESECVCERERETKGTRDVETKREKREIRR